MMVRPRGHGCRPSPGAHPTARHHARRRSGASPGAGRHAVAAPWKGAGYVFTLGGSGSAGASGSGTAGTSSSAGGLCSTGVSRSLRA